MSEGNGDNKSKNMNWKLYSGAEHMFTQVPQHLYYFA